MKSISAAGMSLAGGVSWAGLRGGRRRGERSVHLLDAHAKSEVEGGSLCCAEAVHVSGHDGEVFSRLYGCEAVRLLVQYFHLELFPLGPSLKVAGLVQDYPSPRPKEHLLSVAAVMHEEDAARLIPFPVFPADASAPRA